MLLLDDILVMQADLRHWDHILEMSEYVRNGGFWTEDYLEIYSKGRNLARISPLIAISRFEDAKFFIHDGHHRSVATYLGGRDYLRNDEYILTDWSYDQYLEISPENGWYTPFDPRIHVRKADFGNFKKLARDKFANNPEEAFRWVLDNLEEFRCDRTFGHVKELAAKMGLHERHLVA